jgi:hypothetical protein
LRTSLYADDAAVFVAPIKSDIQNLAGILERFGEVTGLCTNFLKSSVAPIRCGNIDLDDVLQDIPASRATFPLRYLGIPLSVWSLRRRDFQHLEDKCAGKLPTWNGKMVNMAGRVSLVKSVLASQAIYHLTPLSVPPGTLKFINKIERAYVWAAKKVTSRAKCKVNWETVCRPKCYGGLGVLHLGKFSTALRLRWPWLEWKGSEKIWVGTGNPCNAKDVEIFYAATNITLGDGRKTPFWHAPWVGGLMPKDVVPKIFDICKRKKWTVAQALHNDEWIAKLSDAATISIDHLDQFVKLWALIQRVHLTEGVEDDITWKLTANGQYSEASAYKLQFFVLVESSLNNWVWKAWGPPKVKHHAWLALQNRLWTADRLRKRGWDNCGLCPLCKQTEENNNHHFVHCRFMVRVWELLKEWLGIQGLQPRHWAGLATRDWWSLLVDGTSPHRKGLASLALLTV